MSDNSIDKLCDQDKNMVSSVLVENEGYYDSLHNDGDRTFSFATDMRVAKCTWQYDGGTPKVKSAKSFTYDRITRAFARQEKNTGNLEVVIELNDSEPVCLIKMPEHFLKETKEFVSVISETLSEMKTPEPVKAVSSVGAIVANLDELVKLAQLLQMGAITAEEYNEAKSIIMRRR